MNAVLALVVFLTLTVVVALFLCLRAFLPRSITLSDDEDEDSRSSFFFLRNSNLLRSSSSSSENYNNYQPDAATLRNTNPYAIATHARSVAFERALLQNVSHTASERTRGRGLFSFPRRFTGGDHRDGGQGARNNSINDLTVEQKQVVEEMGVQAWEFVMDFELNCIVQDRTEVVFLEGEGGCLQTNLPLPKQKDIYYWEVKVFEKNPKTVVSVGLATKPYPNFRYPGWNKTSVGYQSDDGRKYVSDAFAGRSYGKPYHQGDVIGIGYRPQSGTVFFTRNGMRLEDAQTGMKQALYPTVATDGPCTFHVNLGQLGFVFIEANVKKWGLAPAQGSQAPPPAYGLAEQHGDLILLEASSSSSTFSSAGAAPNSGTTHAQHFISHLHSSQPSPLSHQSDTRPFPSSLEPVPSSPHNSARSSTGPRPSGTDTFRTTNLHTPIFNASTPSLDPSSFLTPTPTSPMHSDDIELEWEENRQRGVVVPVSSTLPNHVSITTKFPSPEEPSPSVSSSTSSFTPPLSSSSSPFISLNVIEAAGARSSDDNRYNHVHTSVGPPPAYSMDLHCSEAHPPAVPVMSPNIHHSDGRAWNGIRLEQNSSDANIERGNSVEGRDC